MIKCPRCKQLQGQKFKEDFRFWFECASCQLKCLMKELQYMCRFYEN